MSFIIRKLQRQRRSRSLPMDSPASSAESTPVSSPTCSKFESERLFTDDVTRRSSATSSLGRKTSVGMDSYQSCDSTSSEVVAVDEEAVELCVPTFRRSRPSCSCQDRIRRLKHRRGSRRPRSLERVTTADSDMTACTAAALPHLFFVVQCHDLATMTELLMSYKCDVNTPNEDGISLLHFAAMTGFSDCVPLLRMHGACLNLADARGQSALGYADVMGQCYVSDCLLRLGALGCDE